jgi:hypothetical protein
MSVAAAIEIGAGGSPAIGEAGNAGTTTGILSIAGAMPSSPDASGAPSFRSNWQTFLESLNGEPGLTDATAAGGADAESSLNFAAERLAPTSTTGIDSTCVQVAGDPTSSVQNSRFGGESGTSVHAAINVRAWIERGASLHGGRISPGLSLATPAPDFHEAESRQSAPQAQSRRNKIDSGGGSGSETSKPLASTGLQSVVVQGVTPTQPESLLAYRGDINKGGPVTGPSSPEGRPAVNSSRPKEDPTVADKFQLQRPGGGTLNITPDSGSKDVSPVSGNNNDAGGTPAAHQPLQRAEVSGDSHPEIPAESGSDLSQAGSREGPSPGIPDANRLRSNLADVTPPSVGRASASRSGRAIEPVQERSTQRIQDASAVKAAHSTGASGFAGDASPLSSWHPGGSLQDAISPALVRDPGGVTGENGWQGNAADLAHGRLPDATAPSGQDTFAALDADRTSPSTTWINAGAHHAEAGYLDPSLGWVSVRADVAGSAVHAAVIPGSADAAQALGSHLTALNAYLAEHHGQSAIVTLAAPENSREGSEFGQGRAFGNQGGAQEGSGGGREPNAGNPRGLSSGTLGSSQASPLAGPSGATAPMASGNYISVMA